MPKNIRRNQRKPATISISDLVRLQTLVGLEEAGKHAEHAGADGRQSAQEPFRIAGDLPQPPGQIVGVKPVRQIGVRRERADADPRHRDEREQRPIADQQHDQRHDDPSHMEIEKQKRREQIANRDTLQYPDKADVAPMLADATVIDQSQTVQQQRAAEHPDVRLTSPSLSTSRDNDSAIATPLTKMNSGKMKS